MNGERYLRPGAALGLRDERFAEAMRRAEQKANPEPAGPSPHDPVGITRSGLVVRRSGEVFTAGPYLDRSSLPLIDGEGD